MEQKDFQYFVFESLNAKHERTEKRLILTIIVLICFLVVSNLAWLYTWNQYDFSTEDISIETDDQGTTNYMGAGAKGVITNGFSNQGQTEDDN